MMSAIACSKGMFRCDNGFCIDEKRHCDDTVDCNDGSDESNCARNVISIAIFLSFLSVFLSVSLSSLYLDLFLSHLIIVLLF